jgi:hypothetical protein
MRCPSRYLLKLFKDDWGDWDKMFQEAFSRSELLSPGTSRHGSTRTLHIFKQQVLDPLCDYLDERLDDQHIPLGYLLRYKQRCEWFTRAMLYTIAEQERQKRGQGFNAQVEKALKQDLYCYLHDQGIDFIIEPRSSAGEIDLIEDQKGPNPIGVEVKIFDNAQYKRRAIRQGSNQIRTYVEERQTTFGYLAAYKLCDEQIRVIGDGSIQGIDFIRVGGKTVYIFVIDLFLHTDSASVRKDKGTIDVTKDYLVKEAKDGGED